MNHSLELFPDLRLKFSSYKITAALEGGLPMITRTQSATFVVAICLVLGTITMVALPLARTSPAYAKPMKGKLLRRKDDVNRKPDPKERAALRGQDSEKQNKRVLKVREFKDMPVVLNEVRNLQSDTWYKDLEIEVKNVSSKPIYSILIYLDFPDVQVAAGVSGITMDFGLNKYIDISVMAEPGDLHLNPGDTYVFTIPEQYRKGLRWKQEHTPERMKKFGLHYAVISFGDGTGFAIDEPADYRLKRPNGSAEKNHHSNNRKNLGFIRAPPQDGCGTCGRYAFDSQLHRIVGIGTMIRHAWAGAPFRQRTLLVNSLHLTIRL